MKLALYMLAITAYCLICSIAHCEQTIDADGFSVDLYRGHTYTIYESHDLKTWNTLGTYNLSFLQLRSVRFYRRHESDSCFYQVIKTGAGSYAPTLEEWNMMDRGPRFGLRWFIMSENRFLDDRHYGEYTYQKASPNTAKITFIYPDGRMMVATLIFTGPDRGYYTTDIYEGNDYTTTLRGLFNGTE